MYTYVEPLNQPELHICQEKEVEFEAQVACKQSRDAYSQLAVEKDSREQDKAYAKGKIDHLARRSTIWDGNGDDEDEGEVVREGTENRRSTPSSRSCTIPTTLRPPDIVNPAFNSPVMPRTQHERPVKPRTQHERSRKDKKGQESSRPAVRAEAKRKSWQSIVLVDGDV